MISTLTTTAAESIDHVLAAIREALHRRGRFSSRNEALDETAKLFFAHLVILQHSGGGLGTVTTGDGAAAALREACNAAIELGLADSKDEDVNRPGFALQLRDDEDLLASDIIIAFKGAPDAQFLSLAPDVFNDVFTRFMSGAFADEKELGQYLTPPNVVEFMVDLALRDMSVSELAELYSGNFGLVLDPSCGTASFLSVFAKHVEARLTESRRKPDAQRWLNEQAPKLLVGVDKSDRMLRLARANLATLGFKAPLLHHRNALTEPIVEPGSVGLILTNPPFGAEYDGEDLAQFDIANIARGRTVTSELLFLERYLRWLKPGGQCVAVLPDSILTNKGTYAAMRNLLRTEIELVSVVSLPRETFAAAGTSTKTSVVHFRRQSGSSSGRQTLFAVCNDIGFTVAVRGGNRKVVSNGTGQLAELLNDSAQFGHETAGVRWRSSATAERRWDATFHAGLPLWIDDAIDKLGSSALKVSDVASLSKERAQPSKHPGARFSYVQIADIDARSGRVTSNEILWADAPSRARKLARQGDVLVSTVRVERGAIGTVQAADEPVVCSTGFAVLRPERVDGKVLESLLKSEFCRAQITRNNVGISYPAIDESCLLDIVLPVRRDRLEELSALAKKLSAAEEKSGAIRQEFAAAIDDAMVCEIPDDYQTAAMLSNHVPSPIVQSGF